MTDLNLPSITKK
uniref:Photosystem I subunit VIII n=1 Tax=Allium ovalifolium TaxID=165645 RepID=A0A650CZQ4_9ASPA|nr:photosystem I subunit VIII [Allium ovalifolium]